VDELIVDFAIKGDYMVATQDKEIKAKLKKHNKESITLRQKKYLIIT
jgi:rRNA-processing protein FCF1